MKKFIFVVSVIIIGIPLITLANDQNTRICVLLGYPGSGKGTLAKSLDSSKYGVFSVGDLLRNEVKNQTALGHVLKDNVEMKDAKSFQLIPEYIINRVITAKIRELKQTRRFLVMDGYPKTKDQIEFINSLFKQEKITPIYVYIKTDPDVCSQRISNRYFCNTCNTPYNSKDFPKDAKMKCPVCNVDLQKRKDDSKLNLSLKQDYFKIIMPHLLQHYREKNMLIEFNGNQDFTKAKIAFHKLLKEKGFP